MSEGRRLPPEQMAQAFHEAYEELAPQFGYKTREASAVPWADVPESNKRLMIATCERVARALLAQPEPAAREAVLVGALKRVRHSLSPNELAVEVIKSEDPQHSHFTAGALMTRNLTYEVIIAIDDALADTSPAAAALLAQGERLREIQEWQEEWDGVGAVDWPALSAILARAALPPGEETGG